MPYRPTEIEPRWQRHWDERGTYVVTEDRSRPKFYALDMFPYPSGKGLHVGHPVGYTAGDVVSRYKRAHGFNVLHTMGYDAFGLPAEQKAIDEGVAPQVSTAEAIETFRAQLKRLGISYDWTREVSTCDPGYYKWTQWIFTRLYERGLAYLGEAWVNWCPALGSVLANDEVIDGRSERGGHPVERRKMSQWMIRITAYAEKLLEGLDAIDWPEATKTAQREWIGRSEGAFVEFPVEGHGSIRVFTTRPDTIFGATYMVLAPEHPLVDAITAPTQRAAVEAYRRKAASKSERDRQASKEKTGVDTGARATNPATGESIPVWIADYVIQGYGTGAIMAVPAHDERDWEFARAMSLPIREVISGGDVAKAAHTGDGVMVNSGRFDGTDTRGRAAVKGVTQWLAERGAGEGAVTFKMRDWTFARQRYWGEPIPMLKDGDAPVRALTLDELPLELPPVDDYRPSGDGRSPLARAAGWARVNDPVTGRELDRETDTMPGSAGSSWYFLRYCDPRNAAEFCAREKSDYWMPVDLYVGGAEHRVGHLMYARMWQRFLHDEGLVRDAEPFTALRHQGMLLAETYYLDDGSERLEHVVRDVVEVIERGEKTALVRTRSSDAPVRCQARWEKMSKRKGNVVNPDEVIEAYGTDALRVYLCFLTPLESDKPWQTSGLEAQFKWLQRVWRLYFEGDEDTPRVDDSAATEAELRAVHKAIRKVGDDIASLNLNTAISALHIATKELASLGARSRAVLEPLIQLLAPFAPHFAEEVWTRGLGHELSDEGVAYVPWPRWDPRWAIDETVTFGVQVNGKTVDTVSTLPDADEATAVMAARAVEKVARALEGKTVTKTIYKAGRILNFIAR